MIQKQSILNNVTVKLFAFIIVVALSFFIGTSDGVQAQGLCCGCHSGWDDYNSYCFATGGCSSLCPPQPTNPPPPPPPTVGPGTPKPTPAGGPYPTAPVCAGVDCGSQCCKGVGNSSTCDSCGPGTFNCGDTWDKASCVARSECKWEYVTTRCQAELGCNFNSYVAGDCWGFCADIARASTFNGNPGCNDRNECGWYDPQTHPQGHCVDVSAVASTSTPTPPPASTSTPTPTPYIVVRVRDSAGNPVPVSRICKVACTPSSGSCALASPNYCDNSGIANLSFPEDPTSSNRTGGRITLTDLSGNPITIASADDIDVPGRGAFRNGCFSLGGACYDWGSNSWDTGPRRVKFIVGSTPTPIPSATPVPQPPTGLRASCGSPGTTATFNWDSSAATRYAIRIDDQVNPWGGYSPFPGDVVDDNVLTNSYSSSTQQGHTYHWWLHAAYPWWSVSTDGGNFTCYSPPGFTPTPAPTTPTLSCGTYDIATGTTPVTISWANGTGLQVWDSSGTWWWNSNSSSPRTISGIPPGRTVSARTTYDYVTFSSTSTATCPVPTVPPPTIAPTPPAPPTNLNSSCPVPGTSASLTWSASAGATKYAVRVDDKVNGWNGYGPPILPGDIIDDNVVSTSYNFTSQPGHTYSWWIHAINNAGWSGSALGVDFTCTAPIPSQPTLSCGTYDIATGTTPVTISWANGTGLQVWDSSGTWWWNSNSSSPRTISGIPPGRTVSARTTYDYVTFSAIGITVCPIPTSTPTPTPTATPIPPWYKFKDASFNKQGSLTNPIPVGPTAFGLSDPGNAFLSDNVIGANDSGLILYQNSINITSANPAADVSRIKWVNSSGYSSFNSSFSPSSFIEYVKSRKEYVQASSFNQLQPDKINLWTGGAFDVNSPTDENQITTPANQPKVILVQGNVNINQGNGGRFGNTNTQIAIIATGTITINHSIDTLYGILAAGNINFSDILTTTPLEIHGNIISGQAIDNSPTGTGIRDRGGANNTTPSILIVFDANQYINLLPLLSTATYEWKQLQ